MRNIAMHELMLDFLIVCTNCLSLEYNIPNHIDVDKDHHDGN